MLVLWALTVAGAVLLLAAGVGHVIRRRHLAAVLATHPLPMWARRLVGAGLGVVEIVVGVGVVSALLTGGPAGMAVTLLALLYSIFTGYLIRLLRVAPGVSCGCFGGDAPAGPATIARAGILAAAAWCSLGIEPPSAIITRWTLLAAGSVVALMIATLLGLVSLATPTVRARYPHRSRWTQGQDL